MAAPSKVTNLSYPTTIRIYEKIYVRWVKSVIATSYILERQINGGNYIEVYNGALTNYAEETKLGWNTVKYRVKAINDDGESDYTETENIEVIYCEIDKNGFLYPFNFIVDFSQSEIDLLPNIDDTTEEFIGVDGEYPIEMKYEPRLFDIVAYSKVMTYEEKNNLITNLGKTFDCLKTGERNFRYNNKIYKVKLGSKPSPQIYPNWITLELSLKAYEPYGYSETNILYGNGIVSNNGDRTIYPIFKVTGEATNPIITVNEVDYTLLYTLSETDTVVIDCENKTVTLNNDTNILNYWGVEFPSFLVGNNTVSISNGNLKTYWREKYISL